MSIDRQRAQIDAITAGVPVVVLSATALWMQLAQPEWAVTGGDLLGAYEGFVLMAVGPQVVQAVVGQLLFPRVPLNPWVRGVIMVQVWFHSLVLGMSVAIGAPSLWPVYIGLYITVPLLVVTRLAVRTVVRARAARCSGRTDPGPDRVADR
jgi:hypothetical protein